MCLDDSDCNSPFGACDASADGAVGVCNCMSTFSGENCENRESANSFIKFKLRFRSRKASGGHRNIYSLKQSDKTDNFYGKVQLKSF